MKMGFIAKNLDILTLYKLSHTCWSQDQLFKWSLLQKVFDPHEIWIIFDK